MKKPWKRFMQTFFVTKCGTIINKKYPFLHATPDFLCECDCCGQGCGEVKCPFCIEGIDFDSYVQIRASCLEKHGDEYNYVKKRSRLLLSSSITNSYCWDSLLWFHCVCHRWNITSVCEAKTTSRQWTLGNANPQVRYILENLCIARNIWSLVH